MMDNNIVDISGTLITDLKLSHSVHGQNFYEAILASERTSGVVDEIPILISDKLRLPEKYQALQVIGEFRSYNMVQENGKSKLLLHVLARHLFFEEVQTRNEIYLDGFICKEPTYRETPLGRQLCDILLAVNRGDNKSDYIPCIAWGQNAKYCAQLPVGSHIRLNGRIQSRQYEKMVNDQMEIRTAREVSIYKVNLIEEENYG